jgi:hypothetical protein
VPSRVRALVLVVVALLAASVTAPASADPYGSWPDSCAGATDQGEWTDRSGTVSPSYPDDWIGHSSRANQRTFRLHPVTTNNDDEVSLEVWSGCGVRLCANAVPRPGDDICTVTVTGRVNVHVLYTPPALRGIANWRLHVDLPPQCSDGYDNEGDGLSDYPLDPGCTGPTDTSEISDAPACSDQFDNDGDGRTDYPLDPGCTDANDTSEDPDPTGGPCPPTAPGVVVCLTPGAEVLAVPVTVPGVVPGGSDHVFGYVDTYRFVVGSVATTLPCVVVGVDSTTVNPCAAAGGTFVSRTATLVDTTVGIPGIGSGSPVVTVRVCQATLTAMVNGFGVESAPAYALC